MTGPLAGVRVLDLSTMYSGPMATVILADQGADVIKIEAPEGDGVRQGKPQRGGFSATFATLNRNKRSIVLDLKTDEGQSILKRLVATADVLLENYRPGVTERLGIAYEQLSADNPQLIYVSITGVGTKGPYKGRPFYDTLIQALSGFADLQRDRTSGRPTIINNTLADKITSAYAAQAVSAALYARTRTGRGQWVELSMLDVNLYFLWADNMHNFTFVGDDREPVPIATFGGFLRKTADGYISVMPVQEQHMLGVFRAVERPDLLEDERFSTRAAQFKNGRELHGILKEAYARFTTEEISRRLEAQDVPFARINTRQDILDDPQVQAMGALVEFGDSEAGTMRQPRPSALYHGTPTSLPRPAPKLAEHTEEILRELELSDAQIQGLRESGIIR